MHMHMHMHAWVHNVVCDLPHDLLRCIIYVFSHALQPPWCHLDKLWRFLIDWLIDWFCQLSTTSATEADMQLSIIHLTAYRRTESTITSFICTIFTPSPSIQRCGWKSIDRFKRARCILHYCTSSPFRRCSLDCHLRHLDRTMIHDSCTLTWSRKSFSSCDVAHFNPDAPSPFRESSKLGFFSWFFFWDSWWKHRWYSLWTWQHFWIFS